MLKAKIWLDRIRNFLGWVQICRVPVGVDGDDNEGSGKPKVKKSKEDKMNGAGSIFKYLEVRKNIQRSGDRTVATSLHDKQGPYLYVPQE